MRVALALLVLATMTMPQTPNERPRARAAGVVIGELPTGKHNAITDVAGVRVGHAQLVEGDVRTGVTVILPHDRNPFRDKVPCAIHVHNGFGKLIGYTQVKELGNLESPIALTNTLCVGRVADALVGWLLEQEGNADVRSVNVVVGETNDGGLNDIRARALGAEHVRQALAAAGTDAVEEGCVGAGAGTECLGWKGGIGTSSRVAAGYTVGVLVQSNFGGTLTIGGGRVEAERPRPETRADKKEHGSCMIVIATDAPLDARNLERLASRAFVGMARIGASFSNGSGDYAIAFSTADELRIRSDPEPKTGALVLKNERMSPLFVAVADATEEAILNSLLRATTVESRNRRVEAVPVERVVEAWRRARR